jgi:hypothetical protein
MCRLRPHRGRYLPALVSAVRAATRLARAHDSVEIVIVSPFAASAVDGATAAIRRLWPGPVRLVRAGASPNDTGGRGAPDVGRRAAIRLRYLSPFSARCGGGAVCASSATRPLPRQCLAREGRTVVVWPRDASAPTGWSPRAIPDTAFAVTVYGATDGSVSPGARDRCRADDSNHQSSAGRVVARWSDGEPAATESTLGGGCVRSVAIAVPPSGDLPITSAFRRLAEQLVRPCATAVPGRLHPTACLRQSCRLRDDARPRLPHR